MSNRVCPDCGKELPLQTPAGLCPHCLLKLAERAAPAAPPPLIPRSSEQPGERIGRYKLLEVIGEGGFGTVWLAEQHEPVRRKVALKIIKLGMDTKEVIARFEAERQALALMDHPNIARVFDGGATENGRPFFVMELVKGVRITDYCDTRRLNTEARLKLFIEVCQAVQHAHQKGVIHRDLKPNNVLVTEQDGRAAPKVIDFGIAKATGQELTDKTLFTRFNQMIGTPAYMSPEQAGMGSLDVDTRSDIYSLGVLLYELLTGRLPFSNEELLKAGLDQVLRTIREQDPPKPSTRLSTLTKEDLQTVAQRRGAEPARLSRLVRGELDWIAMKTLEKDRRRRYEQANGLANDIQRFLADEPVEARPPNGVYRLRRFIRRNRLTFTVGAVLVVAVALGMAIEARQSARAARSGTVDSKYQRDDQTQSNSPATNQQSSDLAEKEVKDVQRETTAATGARENEQSFELALRTGIDALNRLDFNYALNEAVIALSFRTNDAAALKLKSDAEAGLSRLFLLTQKLAKLDNELDTMMAMFGLKRNNQRPTTSEASQIKRLSIIDRQTKESYLDRVSWLRREYVGVGNLTPDRENDLKNLKTTIQMWPD